MGDDPDQAAAPLEVDEGADGQVERFGVEAAEAFVDEDSVQAQAAGEALDGVGQAQGQGQ